MRLNILHLKVDKYVCGNTINIKDVKMLMLDGKFVFEEDKDVYDRYLIGVYTNDDIYTVNRTILKVEDIPYDEIKTYPFKTYMFIMKHIGDTTDVLYNKLMGHL